MNLHSNSEILILTQRTVRTWFSFVLWFVHDSRTYCTQRTDAEDVILVQVLCWKWRSDFKMNNGTQVIFCFFCSLILKRNMGNYLLSLLFPIFDLKTEVKWLPSTQTQYRHHQMPQHHQGNEPPCCQCDRKNNVPPYKRHGGHRRSVHGGAEALHHLTLTWESATPDRASWLQRTWWWRWVVFMASSVTMVK